MKRQLPLLFIIFIAIGLVVVTYFQETRYATIQYKVRLVNQVFLKQTDSFTVMKEINVQNSVTKKKLDQEITKQLDDILYDRLLIENAISHLDSFEMEHIEEDGYLGNLISNRDTISKRLLQYVDSTKKIITNDKNVSKDYKRLISHLQKKEINKYLDEVLEKEKDIEDSISIFKYLNDNKEHWHLVDDHIEVLKRKVFDEYQNVSSSSLNEKLGIQLISDTEGPVIDVKNVTIYLNQSVSLENQVSCYDAVDDEVSCQIDGDYDSSKEGEYPISVKAIDHSNNTSEASFVVKVIKPINIKPYSIDVLRNQNVVIVYGLDGNYEYTKVVKVFTCSTGKNNATPVGNFSTTKGATWGALFGGVWGQYTTRIVGSILFHSVPYYTRNKGNLEWEEYNKLGTQASLGCVRLAVRDAKWIFDNTPVGTPVHIYDGDIPAGITKPVSIKIDGSSPNRGWDPTDSDPANPW